MFSLTIVAYGLARHVYSRYPYPFTLPLVTSTGMIIAVLLILDIDYSIYQQANGWVNHLLGAAVVALAYPLYKQLPMLKRLFVPIMISVTFGSFVGVYSGVLLARWVGIDPLIIGAMAPKSVTTPVAMQVAENLGGASSLTAVFVVIAGVSGVLFSPYLYRWFNITHPIGRGIGMGCASHAIGTAKAFENSEIDGAASSIAMTISAILIAMFVSILL